MGSNVPMKDSGVEWIGQIPTHWDIVQPKYKLNRVTRPIDKADEVITCFRDGVVTLRKNRREDGFTYSIKEHGYQQIHPGDLVVHEMDGFAGAIGISDSKGKSTPVYTVIEPDGRTDLKYVAYLLREMSQTGKIESLARSIRERTTDFRWNMWSAIDFPYPPLKEQKMISAYLDEKTKRIDLLIEKIRKKIELLKEQRTALINKCVTKGLAPSVEMKDSGVEWIGQIPKHWEVRKLKQLFKYSLSSVDRHTYDDEQCVFVCHYPNVYNNEKIYSNVGLPKGTCTTDEYKKFKVTEGDILITKDSERPDDIGVPCYIENDLPDTVCGYHLGIIRLGINLDPKFFFRFLQSDYVKGYFYCETSGITRFGLGKSSVENIELLTPPHDEQKRISAYLDEKTKRIDSLTTASQKQITLLNEYRQSLISSAVTGKIRVTEDTL